MDPSGVLILCLTERKDTPKNIPEYQGLTPADYPGDNSDYLVNDGK